jgi:hypothetical protein
VLAIEPLLDGPVTDEALLPSARFWRKEARAAVAAEPLRATIYKKSDCALLVVVNFLRCPLKGKVKINLEKLGVPQEKMAAVRVQDIDTWRAPKGTDLQKVRQPTVEDTLKDAGDNLQDFLEAKPLTEESEKQPLLEFADGVITLEVEGHDFRAVELAW